jgi:hypothetical protein
MNEYKSVQNMSMLLFASHKMLKDKFSVSLSDDKLKSLLSSICKEIEREYANMDLLLNEINKLILSKLKIYMANQAATDVDNVASIETTDEMINANIRQLEEKRRIQSCQTSVVSNPIAAGGGGASSANGQNGQNGPVGTTNASIAPTIITYTQSETRASTRDPETFKTFILNGAHRDWHKYPDRNNLKIQIPLTQYTKYTFYPECICFPEFVKNMTPYVLVNVSDGSKNIVYIFTPLQTYAKWDVWQTVKNAEPILLNNRQWSIQCFDHLNNELELGMDDLLITEAAVYDDENFMLKYQQNGMQNLQASDYIIIRTGSGQQHAKKIIDISHKDQFIVIDKKELNLQDFINSKIMNTNSQFSFIVKYCSKM